MSAHLEVRPDEPFTPGVYVLLARMRAHQEAVLPLLVGLGAHVHDNFGATLHPSDVSTAMFHAARGRCAHLLVTMSSAVVDRMAFHSAADVRRRLLFAAPVGIVQVLTEEAAARFITAYKTGIQQVSEILLSEGWW